MVLSGVVWSKWTTYGQQIQSPVVTVTGEVGLLLISREVELCMVYTRRAGAVIDTGGARRGGTVGSTRRSGAAGVSSKDVPYI